MGDASREIFLNIGAGERTLFYLAAWTALSIFGVGMAVRMWYWARGDTGRKLVFPGLARRSLHVLREVFSQPRLRRASARGWLHLLVFWGFVVLLVGTELLAVQIETPLDFFHGIFYLLFSLLTDLFGLVLLVGVALAAYRRYRTRPTRLRNPGYGLPLVLLGLLGMSGFVVEGLRMFAAGDPWYAWSPAGALVAALASSTATDSGVVAGWHHAAWWAHAVLAFVFIASIPFGAMRHAVVAPLSLFFRENRGSGVLATPFQLGELGRGTAGRAPPETLANLHWTRLMALDACTGCGLCKDSCPAHAAKRPLSPKKVVLSLRARANRAGVAAATPLTDLIAGAAAWSCTTCGACVSRCPVGIRPQDYLVDARRAQVSQCRAPSSAIASLESLQTHGNPLGFGAEQRLSWTSGLAAGVRVPELADGADFELLFWVGCAGAFDERGQRVTRAIVELLTRAGVRFAVLGAQERCTGDPARRLGEEGLFQQLAGANIAQLDQYGVKRILTACPHCFNALGSEYRALGGAYEVVHHSEYLASLIADGRLDAGNADPAATFTYHDPCYLGRHNGIYAPAREVLRRAAPGGLREMQRCGPDSFCCGAGGGHAWFDFEQGERINVLRYREAIETGAATIVTACPYCLAMLEEAASAAAPGDRRALRDVAEILNDCAH